MLTNAVYTAIIESECIVFSMNYWGGLSRESDMIVIKFLGIDYRMRLSSSYQKQIEEHVISKISSDIKSLLASPNILKKYIVDFSPINSLKVVRRVDNGQTIEWLLRDNGQRVFRVVSDPSVGYGTLSILNDKEWSVLGQTTNSFSVKLLGTVNPLSCTLFHHQFFEECVEYISIVFK